MITLHNAIYSLNPTILGDVAYDVNGNEVTYDNTFAEAKLAELQAQETTKEQAVKDAKESALAKLAALGLTADEVKALVG